MESSWRQGSETVTLHILHSNFGGMLRMRVTLHCKRDCCLHPASCVQTLHLSPDLRLQESWNGHEESFHPCLAVAFNLSSASFLQEYYVISINSGLNEYQQICSMRRVCDTFWGFLMKLQTALPKANLIIIGNILTATPFFGFLKLVAIVFIIYSFVLTVSDVQDL